MKKKLFLLTLALIYINSYSQDIEPTINVPSIPSAFSFEKYGDIPVGLSTGTANVNIPVYSINYKGFSLPLSLSYHTSGVKVDENNPDIGLGWNVNFGGMISCSVNGLYDFNELGSGIGNLSAMGDLYANYFNGFPFSGTDEPGSPLGEGGDLFELLPPTNNPPDLRTQRGYTYTDDVFLNYIDGAPDIFSYYFINKMGKFMYNESLAHHTIPFDDIKIERIGSDIIGEIGFKITDKNGIQFLFQDIEFIESYNILSSEYTGSPVDPFINGGGPIKNRNWRLSKIIMLDGEEINFEYETISYTYYSDSAIKHELLNLNIPTPTNLFSYQTIEFSYKFNVLGKRLKKITTSFDNQSILFSYDAVDNTGNELMPLSGISVMNSSDEIKKINFSHSFITGNKRFVLDSINEEGLPGHLFEYNSIEGFPYKNSLQRDLWGYYNYNVHTLLNDDIIGNNFYNGSNKTPNFNSTLKGSLKKITYPTGGSTEFVYEQNQYFGTEKRVNEISSGSITFDESDFATVVESIPFTISSPRIVKISGAIEPFTNYPTGFMPPGTIIQLKNTTTNEIVYQLHLTEDNVSWPYQIDEIHLLETGTYIIAVQNFVEEIGGSFSVTWFDSYEFEGILNAGGLRIKEIIDKPNDNSSGITKKYTYNDPISGISSGYLPGEIKTTNLVTKYGYLGGNDITHIVNGRAYKRSSNSMYNIGNISYQYITVQEESNKSTHEFSKFKDVLKTYDWEIAPNIDYSWLRNIPLKVDYFKKIDQNYILIKQTISNYANLNYSTIPSLFNPDYVSSIDTYKESLIGLNIRFRVPALYSQTSFGPLEGIPPNYTVVPYVIPTNWIYINKTTSTQYDSNGLNPVVTEVNYYYDNPNHLQVTRTETTTSEGDQIKTKIYYPDDIISSTVLGNIDIISLEELNAIDSLKSTNQHRISEPIQVESYKNDVLLSTQRTNYKDWRVNSGGTGNIISPNTIQTAKGETTASNLLEDRLVYYSYDSHGNPLEVSKTDGIHTVYIWGYQQTKSIAKIDNATYNDVLGYVSNLQFLSDSDNDRTIDTLDVNGNKTYIGNEGALRENLHNLRSVLPNSQVTTYTYDPLIGITSITDPRGETIYYHYDEFNRLEYVKDAKGNILGKNEYHYKNQ